MSLTRNQQPPTVETVETIQLPEFNPAEAKATPGAYQETNWLRLSNCFLGKLIYSQDNPSSAFIFLFDVKNKISKYIPCHFQKNKFRLRAWGENSFAIVSSNFISIFIGQDLQNLTQHLIVLDKIQVNPKDDIYPFLDGLQFVLVKENKQVFLMDLLSKTHLKVPVEGSFLKLHLMKNKRFLIVSGIVDLSPSEFYPEYNASFSNIMSCIYSYDFKDSKWIIKKTDAGDSRDLDSIYFSSQSSITVFERFPRTSVSTLTIYNNDVPVRTIERDFSRSDGTFQTLLAPNGLVFFTKPHYKWAVYNPFTNKEYQLDISFRGEQLMFLDANRFGTCYSDRIDTFCFQDLRLALSTKNILTKQNMPSGIVRIIGQYAFSFFLFVSQVHIEAGFWSRWP